MALELIGGSILTALIDVLVDRLASRQVLGFFKNHELDDGLLEKLKETLNTVSGLLDDAEEKQITKLAVKNWLNDVKHAVYEAEDILDEIDYKYLRSKDIDRHDSNWQTLYAPSDFSMHDIVSDLAEYASGEFCFKLGINESGSGLEGEHSCSLPERTRYLSITSGAPYGGGLRIFRSIQGVQYLRALFPLYILREVDIEALNDILPNLKRLRMLSLYHPKDISSQLLNSIGNLKHLRHLDLSCTAIKSLPKRVGTLYYLQSLLLKECRNLMNLPSNLSNLVDLQHLDTEGTNLKEMPPKMGKLTKLRILESYSGNLKKDKDVSMEERFLCFFEY